MCAKKFVLLPDDSRGQFAALESALLEELRPEGAVATLLAQRLIAAAWRLARADRLEFELLIGDDPRRSLGRALIRDGGAFATLVRYRNGAQAEFFRILKALQARQAGSAAEASDAPGAEIDPTPVPAFRSAAARAAMPEESLPRSRFRKLAAHEAPDEAEPRTSVPARDAKATRNEPECPTSGHRCATQAPRNEPEHPQRASGGPCPAIVSRNAKRERGARPVISSSGARADTAEIASGIELI